MMSSISAFSANRGLHSSSLLLPTRAPSHPWVSVSVSGSRFFVRLPMNRGCKFVCVADSTKSDPNSDSNPSQIPELKARGKYRAKKSEVPQTEDKNPEKLFPPMKPKRPRRGRRSEAAAVEDYVRDSLERTFSSIRQQNPEILKNMEKIMKDKVENDISLDSDASDDDDDDDDDGDEDQDGDSSKKKMLIEEDAPDWPLDADVGWGIRASEYFEQHPIKNVVGDDGHEIDWEGEIDDGLVKEINCLEWESFAFHPSPLIVLVFERYNRASDNWKVLKELENAAMVYWKAKDRLPPRTVKIDINIERDLAYALKVKECPQILFLRGNKVLYREKGYKSADELVQMIAHFYYNAKKPSCVNYDPQSPPH
ncbi:thioredoxin-like fold domain-containing protein MRL7, chloroplastic [Henckelia pumila]|uniref:thioredoxin-like fold domain-containing protein MRL7, chloroplastic n=1 Tax=Henckelia pumila TaxID=405737 RepID=UPI003C6DC7CA